MYIGFGVIGILSFIIFYYMRIPVTKEVIKKKGSKEKEYIDVIPKKEEKKGFGKLLYYSGISKRFEFIDTGVYILLMGIVCAIAVTIAMYATENMIVCGISGVVSVLFMYLLVIFKAEFNNRRVERQLIKFANLVDTFSASNNGDLLALLNNISGYLDNPLRDAVIDCVNDAMVTGDTEEAVELMKDKIQSPLFKDIINNLFIASKHEANYKEVVKAYRKILKNHEASKQNKKSLIASARSNILVMGILSAIILKMVEDSIEGSIWDLFTDKGTGIFFCGGALALVLIIIFIYISIGREKE